MNSQESWWKTALRWGSAVAVLVLTGYVVKRSILPKLRESERAGKLLTKASRGTISRDETKELEAIEKRQKGDWISKASGGRA
jgi:hypothetical protein